MIPSLIHAASTGFFVIYVRFKLDLPALSLQCVNFLATPLRHPMRVRTALTLDVMYGVIAPLIDSHVPFVHSLSEPQMVSLPL